MRSSDSPFPTVRTFGRQNPLAREVLGARPGRPVFTVGGQYTSRGWTEWTQGFQFGSAILQFDATGEREFLEIGRDRTVSLMAPHLTHTGVHDHGFNNVSTYGNLLRLMAEGRIPENHWERRYYELALKCSGAVQAARWSPTADGGGYIYSFNGPHSLFVDTIRTLRALAVAHLLGHALMGEGDRRISLLDRLMEHARATARYAVYYGEGRDAYDVRGRVAHESIFNVNDGQYRCPNSQQGYSPFSTWTRGLAWAMCGFAEQLEFLDTLPGQHPASGNDSKRRPAPPAISTSTTPRPMAFPIGTPARPAWHSWATGARRPADPFNAVRTG
jgi:unsaturated chondroitin disaccharide hydrolase